MNKTSLLGKVAVIGGSSKGLGMGCALQLAREGADIVLCARDEKTLRRTADSIRRTSSGRILAVPADLSTPEGVGKVVDSAMRTFKRIDILVANSGGPKPGTFFELDEKDWQEAYHSVLYYVVELYRLIIPQMKKRRWGRIINIASLTVKEPADTLVLSNVFRAGVASLAKTVSRELIKYNITINTVCPGAFKTDRAVALMQERSRKTGVSMKEIERKIAGTLPLGRYQTPEEMGDLIVFLASEQARGITGTTMQIDGGMTKGIF
jgi:3-oxoacyl-[acyl-carrier protein] reductase